MATPAVKIDGTLPKTDKLASLKLAWFPILSTVLTYIGMGMAGYHAGSDSTPTVGETEFDPEQIRSAVAALVAILTAFGQTTIAGWIGKFFPGQQPLPITPEQVEKLMSESATNTATLDKLATHLLPKDTP